MNKTALITGASRGIGLELAKVHASKKGDLVLVARDREKMEKIKKGLEDKFGVRVYAILKDLSTPFSSKEVYNEVKKLGLRIDYLINNAGIGNHGFFFKTDWKKEEQMIELNVKTLTHLTKLYLKDMVKEGSGRIMNVASTAAFQPGPLMSVYYASKAYVLHFSEAVDNEARERGVTVTTLCPGPTSTGFAFAANAVDSPVFKNKKLPTAKHVAEYGYAAMLKGKPVAIHGVKNRFLAFLNRLAPRSWSVRILRKMQEK